MDIDVGSSSADTWKTEVQVKLILDEVYWELHLALWLPARGGNLSSGDFRLPGQCYSLDW